MNLLDAAKHAVELAIEKDETGAIERMEAFVRYDEEVEVVGE